MRKYQSNLAFVDFLFILLLAFISMFILALILINPVTKKSEVERKAEFLITLEWDKESRDDVDIWVEDPLGKVVSFRNKTVDVMHLDKDDLGQINDTIRFPDGTTQIIYLNREVVTLRGWVAGEYTINAHMYNKRDISTPTGGPMAIEFQGPTPTHGAVRSGKPTEVRVEMLRINPYKILFKERFTLSKRGEEVTVRRVTLNKDGDIVATNKRERSFITLSTH